MKQELQIPKWERCVPPLYPKHRKTSLPQFSNIYRQ